MNNNHKLDHLTNINEAAQELHRRFIGMPWYIKCQVIARAPDKGAVTSKQEIREIVVYVKDIKAVDAGMSMYNSWPIRYEQQGV